VLDEQRNQPLGHRSLGGPHAAWRTPEALAIELDGGGDLRLGVLRVREARRQRRSRAIDRPQISVHEQRSDGMKEGCHRDLNLTALLQVAVKPDDVTEDLMLLSQHCLDITVREASSLLDESLDRRLGAVR
jgi:hypothetical protein